MTVGELMQEVRLEMSDELKTRWSDEQIMKALGKGFRRLGHVLHRNDVELGRAVHAFHTEPGRAEYPLPGDFMVDHGLYRDGAGATPVKQSENSWALLDSPPECSAWLIRGDTLHLAGTPTGSHPMTLVYWPLADTSSLDQDSPTPYGGKLDDIVAEYAALRLKNIDEMDVSMDAKLLQDMENNLLATYSAISPATVTRRGWLA